IYCSLKRSWKRHLNMGSSNGYRWPLAYVLVSNKTRWSVTASSFKKPLPMNNRFLICWVLKKRCARNMSICLCSLATKK
ncbi:bacterial extracellular solute-binding s, 5 Middle family protein, partial [Vibrio parahaemolyticus V-223/04]